MKLLVSLVAAAACLTAAPAMAQVYGSVGYSAIKASDIDANFGAITGRIGAHINPYIGGEVEGAFGVKDDTVNVDVNPYIIPVKLKLDHEFGAYVVGFWPVKDNFELLGRVGYASVKGSGSSGGYSMSESGNGVAYGVGAQYFFTKHNGIRADYTRDEAAGDNVWTLSYAFRF